MTLVRAALVDSGRMPSFTTFHFMNLEVAKQRVTSCIRCLVSRGY